MSVPVPTLVPSQTGRPTETMYLGMQAWAPLLICDADLFCAVYRNSHAVAHSCVELIPNYLMSKAQLLLNTQAARYEMHEALSPLISQNP